ncbi:MAG: inositol phosphorylceramide synthase [Polyangiaceae bacterium]|nr:inositol phosphorylceramide synthase [Polyangiaceae bacterium]MCW5792669.1 inositol phosphorylceramide synthase [Polyangiaceae bacterium]
MPLQRLVTRLKPQGYGASWAYASLGVVPAGLLLVHAVIGLGSEHYAMAAAFLVLAWVGPRARQFSALVAPFALCGLTYQFLPLIMPLRGDIDVAFIWELERALFSVGDGPTLGDALAARPHPVLDTVSGLVYITYFAQIILLTAWFHFRGDPSRALRVGLAFAVLNVMGWVTWVLLWPAAPPWYVDIYGLGPAVMDAAPSAAGALRFDALIGVPLFHDYYAKSTNVFGAMPSLHMGYATLAAIAGWRFNRPVRIFSLGYALLMAFSAMYLRHHYLLDLVAGAAYAAGAYFVIGWAMARSKARSHVGSDERQPSEAAELAPSGQPSQEAQLTQ